MTTDIALIEIKNPLQVFSTVNGLDSVIDKIEAEVKAIDRDISTEKGRDNIRSLAFKIAKSKTALDKIGKELTEEQRAVVNAVNAERKRAWERMEALQEEIRQPLTEWENIEKDRVAVHESALADLELFDAWDGVVVTAALVQERLNALMPKFESRDWQEFRARALLIQETMAKSLNERLSAVTKQEQEAAELARLRAEEQARLQAEREAKIAAEAKAAAEKKAKDDADALAEKVRAEAEAAAQREKEAQERAEKAEKKAEDDRIAAALAAQEFTERVEADRIAAENKAESDKKLAADAAAKAERDRHAAVQEAERTATAAREADKEHKKKINNEALLGVLSIIFSQPPEDCTEFEKNTGKNLIKAIASGQIAHVKITY